MKMIETHNLDPCTFFRYKRKAKNCSGDEVEKHNFFDEKRKNATKIYVNIV